VEESLPFGKYKGRLVREVPTSYLEWATETVTLPPGLREAIREELERRRRHSRANGRASPLALAVPDPEVALEVITAGKRALALKYHPDRGGQTERMRKVLEAAEALTRLVGGRVGAGVTAGQEGAF